MGKDFVRNAVGRPCAILQLGGSFEPPLEIEENPRALRVLLHRPKHEFVVEIIEEAADVEVDDPGIPPASLPRTGDSIERRLRGR